MGKLYLKKIGNGIPRKEITEIGFFPYGKNAYLKFSIYSEKGYVVIAPDYGLSLAAELEDIARRIRDYARNGSKPGVVRADVEPSNGRKFIFEDDPITLNDIAAAESDVERWQMLIKHFTRSSSLIADDGAFIEALKDGYKQASGKSYKPVKSDNGQMVDQLSADLDVCWPHRTELIQDGEARWGAQLAVSKLLNLPNSGGVYRQRILDVLAALAEDGEQAQARRKAA